MIDQSSLFIDIEINSVSTGTLQLGSSASILLPAGRCEEGKFDLY